MRNKMIYSAAFAGALLLGSVGAMQAETHTKTVTGCLSEKAGEYMLKESGGTGDGMKVTGNADLAKHVNHTVKLTVEHDSAAKDKAHDMHAAARVTKIEHVSENCNAK